MKTKKAHTVVRKPKHARDVFVMLCPDWLQPKRRRARRHWIVYFQTKVAYRADGQKAAISVGRKLAKATASTCAVHIRNAAGKIRETNFYTAGHGDR